MSHLVRILGVVSVVCICAATVVAGNRVAAAGIAVPISFPIDNAVVGWSISGSNELPVSNRLAVCPGVSFSMITFGSESRVPGDDRTYQNARAFNLWLGIELHCYVVPIERSARPFLLVGAGFNNMDIHADPFGYSFINLDGNAPIYKEQSAKFSIGVGVKIKDQWLVVARLERTTSAHPCTEMPIQIGFKF